MSVFKMLNEVNVNEYTEKKGNFTYLSWAFAVRELLKAAPESTWKIHEYSHGNGEIVAPYMRTGAGCFVKVTVTADNVDKTQVHPVLDHMNKTVDEPNAFQINTSIQRCLAKAIALHGLGLYIYAGEDLPVPPDPLNSDQISEIMKVTSNIGDAKLADKIKAQIDDGVINDANFKGSVAKLERMKS
jgi:hypothetical protein|tara:strand:+ start:5261 stop:5818 length:558 start_codon:yes stop_codon:yes gene_type:complete